jgi:RNA polymerase sigma factor (sigma-70 family)
MQARFIIIDGQPVEVSEEVYRAFKRPAWAERKRRKVKKAHEISLDAYGGDAAGMTPSFEDGLLDSIALDSALLSLTADERNLIESLFFKAMTEREYAVKIGIAQKNVNARKQRALEKLKKFLAG